MEICILGVRIGSLYVTKYSKLTFNAAMKPNVDRMTYIVCAGILPTPLDLAVKTHGLNLFPCILYLSNHIDGLPKIHIFQNVKEF